MLGHHSVFKIADTAMVYIPNEEVRETHPGKLFQNLNSLVHKGAFNNY